MIGMAIRGTDDQRGTWFFPVVGAVIGLALGVLVSVTTHVPLAPEAGLVLGALAGWLAHRLGTR
jgi:cobalamin synthase